VGQESRVEGKDGMVRRVCGKTVENNEHLLRQQPGVLKGLRLTVFLLNRTSGQVRPLADCAFRRLTQWRQKSSICQY
jgi:hypothetical protein